MAAWEANEFKLGVNMAGAISAGAYTAGVLDFLMEALEEWQKAKDAFRAFLSSAASASFPNPVPLHDVSIEVFSGASAGGMCAAIASVMVQSAFEHIRDPEATNTSNTFYEAWVNEIDIRKLLTTKDVRPGTPLTSLLDSTILDTIAVKALTPGAPTSRPYISPSLTLFLTLTNVRGIQYQLYNDPSPTVNEFTTYYGDRLRFETVASGSKPGADVAKPLPIGQPNKGAWDLLREAAKATGAFPIFLAPRLLIRDLSDYGVPGWVPLNAPPPHIQSDLPRPPGTIVTLNVDGGVIDNDPFELAHDFLVSLNPKAKNGHNPTEPLEANCAIVSVAPFPSVERYDPNFDLAGTQRISNMLGRLVTILLSQSRFFGESLPVTTSGAGFSRFVIAPSDPTIKDRDALQSAPLGAFGGFLERSFRAHDFMLGRYNCQRFLDAHFLLPFGNPVIDAGQHDAGLYAARIQEQFAKAPPPGTSAGPSGNLWTSVIPLVGSAAVSPSQSPDKGTISKADIGEIAGLVLKRLDAIKGPLLDGAPAAGLLKAVVGTLCAWPGRMIVQKWIVDELTRAFSPDVVAG
jgi:predicted acylesterase/phospholipase RssA